MEKNSNVNFNKCVEIADMFCDILAQQKVKRSEAIWISIAIIVQSCSDICKINQEEFTRSLVEFINDNVQTKY